MNYAVSIFSLIIGVFSIWFSIKFIGLYLKVRKWNRISATITSKELFIHPKYSTSRTPYGLKVNYTYQLNNTAYTGHTVYLAELAGGQVNLMKSDAEKRLYKIEPIMSVYVKPNDPTQSVIYCEGVVLYFFVFGMGFSALLIVISNIL